MTISQKPKFRVFYLLSLPLGHITTLLLGIKDQVIQRFRRLGEAPPVAVGACPRMAGMLVRHQVATFRPGRCLW